MVHVVLLVVVAAALVFQVATGALALVTGRGMPWQRGYPLRPRLWGSGALVFTAGMVLGWYAGTVRVSDAVFICSLLMLLCGGALQLASQRVGRLRR